MQSLRDKCFAVIYVFQKSLEMGILYYGGQLSLALSLLPGNIPKQNWRQLHSLNDVKQNKSWKVNWVKILKGKSEDEY